MLATSCTCSPSPPWPSHHHLPRPCRGWCMELSLDQLSRRALSLSLSLSPLFATTVCFLLLYLLRTISILSIMCTCVIAELVYIHLCMKIILLLHRLNDIVWRNEKLRTVCEFHVPIKSVLQGRSVDLASYPETYRKSILGFFSY